MGLANYMAFEAFQGMAADGMGALTIVGTLWAYVLPGLMILGGALIALGMYMNIGAWLAGLALASIPVGMLLKPVLSGFSLADAMPSVVNAFVWLLVYLFVVKCSGCSEE